MAARARPCRAVTFSQEIEYRLDGVSPDRLKINLVDSLGHILVAAAGKVDDD
jgi:hypothetical protein